MLPWRCSRTGLASQPIDNRSWDWKSARPSSALRRSPVRILAAMGSRRASEIWSSAMFEGKPKAPACRRPLQKHPRNSGLSDYQSCAPEQEEQQTNIAIHREKRSIHFAEIVGLYERMLVAEQERDYGNADPRRPRQMKRGGESDEQCNHRQMHHARDLEGAGDAEFFRDRVQAGDAVEIDVLAGVEDVEATDPERDRCAENQHAGGE